MQGVLLALALVASARQARAQSDSPEGEVLRTGREVRELVRSRVSRLGVSAGPDPDTVYVGKSFTDHTGPGNYWNLYTGTYLPGTNAASNALWSWDNSAGIQAADSPANLQKVLGAGGQVIAEIAAPQADLRLCWEQIAEVERYVYGAVPRDQAGLFDRVGDAVVRLRQVELDQELLEAVAVFGKSWDLHVTDVLRTTEEENLEMIADSVEFLKTAGREVVYDAEHFFDGYKADRDYALATLRANKPLLFLLAGALGVWRLGLRRFAAFGGYQGKRVGLPPA